MPAPERLAPPERARPLWMDAFIAALNDDPTVARAAIAADTSKSTVYRERERNPQFAAEWDAAKLGQAPLRPFGGGVPGPNALDPQWRLRFLTALAETSNVSASAAAAGVEPRVAYRTRRTDPAFAAKWQAALFEGYEHLELEVLCHLRSPEPARKMDVAAALRLLAAHRETVIRLKALAGEEDEAAVRDSIDRFLEDMRQRRLANQAILAEAQPEAEDEDADTDVAG